MTNFPQLSADYQRIEQAIHYLEANVQRQPGLHEIAASLNFSEYHFQRLFTRWAGVSPKRFLQYLTKEHAKALLARSTSLLDATYEVGLSSPGRLYDLFVQCEAVTPGEFKSKGRGLVIYYGLHPTPFGECLLGLTDRGICHLAFVQDQDRDGALRDLQPAWANATLHLSLERTRPLAKRIFAPSRQPSAPIHLLLRGTNFQIKVWEALLRIPSGQVTSYEGIAAHLRMPDSGRAVANAVANNPVAYLIPCHRVIRKIGEFGDYRYGPARKKALLAWEMARLPTITKG
jgi:AraC family transcriptional regulator of adaptative response/methylated-DNA-[protein]-cysteine methyltransferase